LICTIFAQWALIEKEMQMLLVRVLGADKGPAHAIYDVLTAQHLQTAALTAAARAALTQDQFEVFSAAIAVANSVQKQRNKLAHWIWARSDQVPNALLLVNPKALNAGETERLKLMSGNAPFPKHYSVARQILGVEFDEILVYTQQALKRIDRDLGEAFQIMVHLAMYLNPLFTKGEVPPDAMGTAACELHELSKLGLFQEALSQIRARQKSTPEAQP
jgi:hypothetical protein